MDPLSALSVAASVVQFVSFTSDVVKLINDAAHSTTGQLQKHGWIKDETKKLLELNENIQQVIRPEALHRPRTSAEETLNDVCSDCHTKAMALMDALSDLEVKPPQPNNGKQGRPQSKVQAGKGKQHVQWKHIQQAIKSIWHQQDIESLQKRLSNSKEMLMMTILVSLREQPSLSDRSRPTTTDTSSKELFSSDQWSNLAEAIEKMHVDVSRTIENHNGNMIQILPWSKCGLGETLISTLLNRLHFPEISDRQERIPKAHEKTFEWIFGPPQNAEKPWDSFADWLESPSDLYWITGKPGSGKSTLMKFLFNDPRTRQHLVKWAGDMNQLGLLQSLLYQALSQRRSLTPRPIPEELHNICLSKNFSRPWVWTELVQSLRILIEEKPSLQYFFLIDGLDEFSGDKSELIDLIGTLAVQANVKICVSSRPWVVFEDAYHKTPSLIIENITYDDIKLYITAKFNASPAFEDMKEVYQAYCDKLVEDITKKASGVFLWVVLPVKSLLEGFSNGDRPQDIQDRLALIPPDLEGLFRKILDSLEPRYFKHASQIFQVFVAAKKPPTVLCMALADQGVKHAMVADVEPLTSSQIRYIARTMRRRLNSRCKGLLEVGSLEHEDSDLDSLDKATDGSLALPEGEQSSGDEEWASEDESLSGEDDELTLAELDVLADAKVQYLHRTVKDFLEQPENWSGITAATDPTFHPYTRSMDPTCCSSKPSTRSR